MSNYLNSGPPPRKHQDDAFFFIYSLFTSGKNYGALFMEQGTGKTKVALNVAGNLYAENKIDTLMVIAPNGVQDQWNDDQIPLHCPVPYETFTWENKGSEKYTRALFNFIKTKKNVLKIFLMNVEAFSYKTHLAVFKEVVALNKTMVIIDEATRIKSPDAERTINVIQGLSELTKFGKRITGIKPLSAYRLILTGTPFTTGPYNVWSMFEFLHHDFFYRDFMSFKAHYGIEVRETKPGGKSYYRKITSEEMTSIRKYKEKGKSFEDISRIMQISETSARYIIDNPSITAPYKNLPELKELIARVSFTVAKKDCLDLPDKIFERRYVRMSSEQERVYKELKSDLLSQYNGVELEVLSKLSLIGRLQQVTGGFFPGKDGNEDSVLIPFKPNSKMTALVEDIEDIADKQIIVVAKFTAELLSINSALKSTYKDKRIELVYGGVRNETRANILNAFKAGAVDILIANSKTIGSGHNLQNSHTTLFYSNTYSFDERVQMEDRTHRDGQGESPMYRDYIVKGTVDEKVLAVLQDKRTLAEYMRDKSLKEFLG